MSNQNKEEALDKAIKDLAAVTDEYLSRLVKELQGTDFWKLRLSYYPGVQEYVEAATLCNFLKIGTLLALDEINATLLPLSDPSVEPLRINILDYILGLVDLTVQLMRLAIGRISEGEFDFAEKICSFVCEIYRNLTLIAPEMDDSSDMKQKMETMLQSVMKIENGSLQLLSTTGFFLFKEKFLFAVEVVELLHLQVVQSVKLDRKRILVRDALLHVLLQGTWAQRFVSL